MTEQHASYVARYLVRKGTVGWMVWDRQTRAPATPKGRALIGMTEEQAREIKDELTKKYIAEG
jgi:hypothetical protein